MNQYEARKQLREFMPRALERVVELLESKNERTALAAAKLILSSAYSLPHVGVTEAVRLVNDAALDDEAFGHQVEKRRRQDEAWGKRPAKPADRQRIEMGRDPDLTELAAALEQELLELTS